MKFPWYDSAWHLAYLEVCDLLKVKYPDKLDDFIFALAPLRTDPGFSTSLITAALSDAQVDEAKLIIKEMHIGDWERHELARFGRLILHDHPFFTELQESLCERVSEACGERVVASYNFLSLYNRRGVCEPHMDDPHAKWTLDVPLHVTDDWPIHISGVEDWPAVDFDPGDNWQDVIKTGRQYERYAAAPGDGLLFSGSSQWHYREPAPDDPQFACYLIFFHFTPALTSELVSPGNWPAFLDVAEIEPIVKDYEAALVK